MDLPTANAIGYMRIKVASTRDLKATRETREFEHFNGRNGEKL